MSRDHPVVAEPPGTVPGSEDVRVAASSAAQDPSRESDAPAEAPAGVPPAAPALRTGWARPAAELVPTPEAVATLVRRAVAGAKVQDVAVLPGGLSNTSLRVELDRPPFRVFVRLYQRDPGQAGKEAAIALRLAESGVRVARVLAVAEVGAMDTPAAVFEWVEGERLDLLASELDGAALGRVGAAVGFALCRVHSIRFDRLGFLDDALGVVHPVAFDAPALLDFLDERLRRRGGAGRLGEALAEAVLATASRQATRLGDWPASPCLVHADCNASNVLVHRDAAGCLELAALLDWEFALSAIPAMDFATLLRPGVADLPGFSAGLERGYRDAGGWLPQGWQQIAQVADLFAWADMLSRPEADAALDRDARRVMRRLVS